MALLSGKQNAKKRQLGCQTELTLCGRDGMVDIPDLKSVGRMPVWVRLPPPAPNYFILSVTCGNRIYLYGFKLRLVRLVVFELHVPKSERRVFS